MGAHRRAAAARGAPVFPGGPPQAVVRLDGARSSQQPLGFSRSRSVLAPIPPLSADRGQSSGGPAPTESAALLRVSVIPPSARLAVPCSMERDGRVVIAR